MLGGGDGVGVTGKGLSYENVNETGSWTVTGGGEAVDLRPETEHVGVATCSSPSCPSKPKENFFQSTTLRSSRVLVSSFTVSASSIVDALGAAVPIAPSFSFSGSHSVVSLAVTSLSPEFCASVSTPPVAVVVAAAAGGGTAAVAAAVATVVAAVAAAGALVMTDICANVGALSSWREVSRVEKYLGYGHRSGRRGG